ncbi:MAG: class II aldolase/adducin family protein [Ilumatobacteraceae bacterium]|nr:class II aldolase/adducin family protein [Ilumatobacteraceae bacterium]
MSLETPTQSWLALDAQEAAKQVALGSQIMSTLGEDLTLGHVSVRHECGNLISIKRKGISLAEVGLDDVLVVDLNDPDGLKVPGMHLEALIHTEIYRARPEIGAVIHSHPVYSTALSSTNAKLEYLTHDSVLFHNGIGRYADSADLIMTPQQGQRVAQALGERRAVLLQNHGVVFVGEDIRWAILSAITLERSLKLQMIAGQLGKLNPIPLAEVKKIFPIKYQDKFLTEYWNRWVRELSEYKGSQGTRENR